MAASGLPPRIPLPEAVPWAQAPTTNSPTSGLPPIVPTHPHTTTATQLARILSPPSPVEPSSLRAPLSAASGTTLAIGLPDATTPWAAPTPTATTPVASPRRRPRRYRPLPVPHPAILALPHPIPEPPADIDANDNLLLGIHYHVEGELVLSAYYLAASDRDDNHPVGSYLFAMALRHGWGVVQNQTEAALILQRAAGTVLQLLKPIHAGGQNMLNPAAGPPAVSNEAHAQGEAHASTTTLNPVSFSVGAGTVSNVGPPHPTSSINRGPNGMLEPGPSTPRSLPATPSSDGTPGTPFDKILSQGFQNLGQSLDFSQEPPFVLPGLGAGRGLLSFSASEAAMAAASQDTLSLRIDPEMDNDPAIGNVTAFLHKIMATNRDDTSELDGADADGGEPSLFSQSLQFQRAITAWGLAKQTSASPEDGTTPELGHLSAGGDGRTTPLGSGERLASVGGGGDGVLRKRRSLILGSGISINASLVNHLPWRRGSSTSTTVETPIMAAAPMPAIPVAAAMATVDDGFVPQISASPLPSPCLRPSDPTSIPSAVPEGRPVDAAETAAAGSTTPCGTPTAHAATTVPVTVSVAHAAPPNATPLYTSVSSQSLTHVARSQLTSVSAADLALVRAFLPLPIYELGVCLMQGWGVPRSISAGLFYVQMAAQLGDRDAARTLGEAYLAGRGVRKSKMRAARWIRRAGGDGMGEAWVWKEKYNPKPVAGAPAPVAAAAPSQPAAPVAASSAAGAAVYDARKARPSRGFTKSLAKPLHVPHTVTEGDTELPTADPAAGPTTALPAAVSPVQWSPAAAAAPSPSSTSTPMALPHLGDAATSSTAKALVPVVLHEHPSSDVPHAPKSARNSKSGVPQDASHASLGRAPKPHTSRRFLSRLFRRSWAAPSA